MAPRVPRPASPRALVPGVSLNPVTVIPAPPNTLTAHCAECNHEWSQPLTPHLPLNRFARVLGGMAAAGCPACGAGERAVLCGPRPPAPPADPFSEFGPTDPPARTTPSPRRSARRTPGGSGDAR